MAGPITRENFDAAVATSNKNNAGMKKKVGGGFGIAVSAGAVILGAAAVTVLVLGIVKGGSYDVRTLAGGSNVIGSINHHAITLADVALAGASLAGIGAVAGLVLSAKAVHQGRKEAKEEKDQAEQVKSNYLARLETELNATRVDSEASQSALEETTEILVRNRAYNRDLIVSLRDTNLLLTVANASDSAATEALNITMNDFVIARGNNAELGKIVSQQQGALENNLASLAAANAEILDLRKLNQNNKQ